MVASVLYCAVILSVNHNNIFTLITAKRMTEKNNVKTPARYLREFFVYSAPFRKLVQNIPQTFNVNVRGTAVAFEWHKTCAVFISSMATPTANDALLIPDIDINVRIIGSDREVFFENTSNAMELVNPAGTALIHATPVILLARSIIQVTVTSGYATQLPFFNVVFTGNNLFSKQKKVAA